MQRISDDILIAVGEEVRRRREAAGYSREGLADRAQLHKNYIARVELGQADFGMSALWSIATALDCEMTDLLPAPKLAITPEGLQAARVLSKADPEVREAVMALVERFSSKTKGRRRPRGGSGG